MQTRKRFPGIWRVCVGVFVFLVFSLLAFKPSRAARTTGADSTAPQSPSAIQFDTSDPQASVEVESPDAACAGGPTIDGVLLDECYIESFLVGGVSKSIRVWYTKIHTAASRVVDGTTVNLQHWIDTDAQAQLVAQRGREAWLRYYFIFGHGPYDTGCGDRINVQLEDGVGWSGIAYWASSGHCTIGIDSPMVRTSDPQWVVYHEFQHYEQYSYNAGCYDYLRNHYDSGKAAGDAEFVEGYADVAADAVDATLDIAGYAGINYNPTTSMFDKNYGNLYSKYFIEQLGSSWTAADPWHHMDALRAHYEACDVADTLYVLDTLIPSLKPGRTEESLFLDFFAANYLKKWANATTQPALVYTDDDGSPYADIPLDQDVTISSGTPRAWNGQTTPDDWAGRYYQVKPQSGCSFVTANVNGTAGTHLGINLMAADTVAPKSVERYGWIGEDFARTLRAYGVFDRITASVNAFATTGSYDISFTCVTPVLDLLEPRQTNYALVGDPASPIAFLARFKLTSGGSPVLGIAESDMTAVAEGDAVTIVPGSFQQVGEEYWAILIPPVKAAGTTFVDLRVCINTTACDTETDALLYVVPGNTDFGLVFDASGSMSTEDIVGEGTRLANAQKAGTVLADLLRVGDRILVTDFSAYDSPAGCGIPYGSGNCSLDIRTLLARTDVTGAGTIASAKTAINSITAREWTPIGAALKDAMTKLMAAPSSTNPKHIVLLSDGDENVNPLYASVKDELFDSGVVIDTIRFSNDAPGALLAQIAADTGGSYRYVPTSSGSLALAPEEQQARADQLTQMGVPAEFIGRALSTFLPGPLGLSDVYDYYETKSQGASRLLHANFTAIANGTDQVASQYVDPSVNTLRLVVSGKQGDNESSCAGYVRFVEVFPPYLEPKDRWFPISPRTDYTPADWDIRNSTYDDVVIISNPTPGIWKVRVHYSYCIGASTDGSQTPSDPQALESDFMINMSAETNLRLQGRFLAPIVNNQGNAGDIVPIIATVLYKSGAVPGAIVLAAIEKPGAVNFLLLLDDGAHSDGSANDGIYGNYYPLTTVGGSYNVTILALGQDATTNWITREWTGAFWINGPERDDLDKDGMPDAWEKRCNLDTSSNDSREDPDHDGLTNGTEFQIGTLPCQADTDRGGEQDGSEYNHQRNPLWPWDDKVTPLRHFSVQGLNAHILIQWTAPITYTGMTLFVSTDPNDPGQGSDIGNGGEFLLPDVQNGQDYHVWLAPYFEDPTSGDRAEGPLSEDVVVTPKEDPDPPSGAMLINQGAYQTHKRQVILYITSADTPLPGIAESANAHLGGPLALAYNTVSGGVQVRVSNSPTFSGATWEPLVSQKPWTLPDNGTKIYRVYIQFRDAAGNESFVVNDEILYIPLYLYLPVVKR